MRRRDLTAEVQELRQELSVMRAENARLRLAAQTPASLGTTAEAARLLLGAASAEDGSEVDADAAATVLANAHLIRASVLAVCDDLETTFGQLRQRLQTGTPAAELNRRVRERRREQAARDEDGAQSRRHPVHLRVEALPEVADLADHG